MGRAQQGSPCSSGMARDAQVCSWGPKHLWAARAGGEGPSVELGALGTAPALLHSPLAQDDLELRVVQAGD